MTPSLTRELSLPEDWLPEAGWMGVGFLPSST